MCVLILDSNIFPMLLKSHDRDRSKSFGTNISDVITFLDDTYIYIQKSADYSFQRRSCSIHKNRHLLKPTMIVETVGCILDDIVPYFADYHNNDAAITKHLLLSNNSAKKQFQKHNILIIDRGFRDAVDFLKEERSKVLYIFIRLTKTRSFGFT